MALTLSRRGVGSPRRDQLLQLRAGLCHKSPSGSSILLVLALAADDVGDIIALVLVGLQEGIVFGAVIGDLDFVIGLAVRDRRLLPALTLGVRLFERDKFDIGGLRGLRGFRCERRND